MFNVFKKNTLPPQPQAISYFDRLKLIVGHPLDDFPKDIKHWGKEKEKSVPVLMKEYGLTVPQAIALQQVLFLIHEMNDGSEMVKEAPITAKGWLELPEIKNLRNLPKEHLMMFIVNQEGKYSDHLLGVGTKSSIALPDFNHIGQLFKKMNGNHFYLVHNHPNNDPEPSDDDIQVTKSLIDHFKNTNIHFADHFIVSKNGWYSFRRNFGWIWGEEV